MAIELPIPRYSSGKSSPIRSHEIGEIPDKMPEEVLNLCESQQHRHNLPRENAIVNIKTQRRGIQSLFPPVTLFSS